MTIDRTGGGRLQGPVEVGRFARVVVAAVACIAIAAGCSSGDTNEVGGSGDCTTPNKGMGVTDQLGGSLTQREALAGFLPGPTGATGFRFLSSDGETVVYELLDGESVRGTATLSDAGGGWHVDLVNYCA